VSQGDDGGRELIELGQRAEELLIRGAYILPGIGVLRLANFYYSQGYLQKTRHLLHEFGQLSLDCTVDNAPYGVRLFEAFDFKTFVMMSRFEMTSTILNCFDNVETHETYGISCLYQNAFNQTTIHVKYTLHEIPCVGIPIVHAIITTCFDMTEYLAYQLRGCVMIPYQMFEYYLRCVCCLHDSLKNDISLEERSTCSHALGHIAVGWTLQLPSYTSKEDGDYRPIAHNLLAYFLVEIRQYARAARHVIRSLEISPNYTNVDYHYFMTALEFCQHGGWTDRNNSRTDDTKSSYLVLDAMIQNLRKQSELSEYADFVQRLMDDNCIMEMLPCTN
jgi:hypothetical protein